LFRNLAKLSTWYARALKKGGLMTDRLRAGIFLAPFHPVDENPTLAIERDFHIELEDNEYDNINNVNDIVEKIHGHPRAY
jgi:hypothetical protein